MATNPFTAKDQHLKEKNMTICLRLISLIFLLFSPASLFAAPATGQITILYTNDVHGATEPCG